MNLARVQALKRELESAFAEGTAPVRLLESLSQLAPADAFLQSLRELPMRQLDKLMSVQTATVLGQAMRGRAISSSKALVVAHGDDQPIPRMAVGYALTEKGDYEIEVRLQNPDVRSFLFARELVSERADVSARIGVLKNLAVHAAHPAAMNNDPLTLGSSVGLAKGLAGSVGGFVRHADAVGVLSCSHILARSGRAAPDEAVFHPSPRDDALGNGRIGQLRRFVDLSAARPKFSADVAFAVLDDGRKPGANVIPKGHEWPNENRALGELRRDPIVKFTAVAKIGRTSGWTTGRVLHENQGPVEIGMPELSRPILVEGLTEIEWNSRDDPFSGKGDSGSLVYLADTLEPIGLVVGGGLVDVTENDVKRTYGASYACPIGPILKEWKLTLLK